MMMSIRIEFVCMWQQSERVVQAAAFLFCGSTAMRRMRDKAFFTGARESARTVSPASGSRYIAL